MVKNLVLLVLLFFFNNELFAQHITGNLNTLSNQTIKLEGFNGFKTYPIATTTIDAKGNFKLNYAKTDYGVGYLMSADNKAFVTIQEEITIFWADVDFFRLYN
jgi:hypothetical protein